MEIVSGFHVVSCYGSSLKPCGQVFPLSNGRHFYRDLMFRGGLCSAAEELWIALSSSYFVKTMRKIEVFISYRLWVTFKSPKQYSIEKCLFVKKKKNVPELLSESS